MTEFLLTKDWIEDGIALVHSILEAFERKENDEIEKTLQISEKIRDKLDTKFDIIEVSAMQIQLGEEES